MKKLLLASSGAAFFALGIFSSAYPAQAVGLYGAYSYKPATGTSTTYNATRVGTIDTVNSRFNPLPNNVGTTATAYLTDIAVRDNPTSPGTDQLYGIGGTTAGSQVFWSIDRTTGLGTNLGSISNTTQLLTGLGFANDGKLYAIGGGNAGTNNNLYTINLTAGGTANPVGRATSVAQITGLNGSGDIVYDNRNDRFFATSLASTLAQGGQNSSNDRVLCFTSSGAACAGETTQVIGSTGLSNLSSMTGLTIENGNLYGYNGYRSDRNASTLRRYRINTDTGAATNGQLISYNGAVPGPAGYFSGTANSPAAEVPFGFSPGLGILVLGAWGAVAQLKSQVKQRKFSKSALSDN